MKNYFRIFAMLTLALVVTLSSCKKDDEEKTATDYLTGGNWTTTGMIINPGIDIGGVVITDVFDVLIEDCSKDDFVSFNGDGTITEDEGATKCDPDDPQTITDGTWTLSSDGTTLTVSYPNEDPEVLTLSTLNDNTMVVVSEETIDFGVGATTYTVTVTMSK